jgi:hypothetical protein
MAKAIVIKTSESAMAWAVQARKWRALGIRWYQRAMQSNGQSLEVYDAAAQDCKREATRIEGAIRTYSSQAERELKEIMRGRTHIGRLGQGV